MTSQLDLLVKATNQRQRCKTKLNYFKCCQQSHQEELLNLICLDIQCKSKRLICSLCKNKSHQNHETVPFKKFLSDVNKYPPTKKLLQEDGRLINEELQNLKNRMLFDLQLTVTYIADLVRECEINIIKYNLERKRRIQDKLILSRDFRKIMSRLYNLEYKKVEQVEEQLEKIIQNYEGEKIKRINIQFLGFVPKCIQIQRQFQTKMKLLTSQISKYFDLFHNSKQFYSIQVMPTKVNNFIDSTTKLTKNLIQQIKIKNNLQLNSQKITEFYFSNKNKGKHIKLSNNNKNAKKYEEGDTRFVFINNSKNLPLCKTKKNTIRLKIKKIISSVGVGIGILNRIKQLMYTLEHNELGCGSYLICSNGFSWSHSQTNDNMKQNSMYIKTGETVIIQFNEPYKQIKYSINEKQLRLKVDLNEQQLKNVYFCTSLSIQGESVQIIEGCSQGMI